ncbi:uncharacterized protein [Musca autumnalis]|uniref:uncharacterized protein n=1 Tax=Musca autumnalis TaxID=221902 RepID=UPI003CE727CB
MKLLCLHLMASLIFWVSGNITTEYSSFVDPFAVMQNPCDDIRNGQFLCKDCATLAFCYQEQGNWNTMEIATCDTARGLYCDETARGCVYQKECISRGPKFECQNAGKFPDPYDCKQYHVCSSTKEDERIVCPSGTAYSPTTKSCSLSTNNEICHKAQYTCNNAFNMGAWSSDPNIYYICWYTTVDGEIVRYPLLYRCQDGYEFIANTCVPKSSPAQPTASAPTTTTSVANPPAASCDLSTNLMPNPNNCRSYYICKNGLLEDKECPSGTYFQASTLMCVVGSC